MNPPIYILGGAQTDFARNWHREGLGIYDMFKQTLDDAFESTGIEPEQIEVGHVGNFVGELFTGQGQLGGFFAEAYPELNSIPNSRHEAACASGSIAILAAMRDIEAGHYDLACVLGVEYMRNTDTKMAADYLGAAAWKGQEANDCDYPWPHMFDRLIDEYDRRHGIDCEHLKEISKTNFNNGQCNPNSQSRNWQFQPEHFSDNDEFNPIIEGRIRRMDCGQVTDGGACVFLASEAAAKQYAKKNNVSLNDIPRIKGWGHRSSTMSLDSKLTLSEGNPLVFPHVAQIMKDALLRSGLNKVTDLDGLETHDCFTITEYMAIDHIGLTAPGESWKAIKEGRIARDGDFPINPSGGLIGSGHPVGATGVRMLLDCTNQVSGRAGDMQIKGAKNMATFNLGGSATTCVSFVVGVD